MARSYVLQRIALDPAWRVLDIGPGTFPLEGPRVWYLDHDPAMLASLPPDRCVHADLDTLPLPLRSGEFDFIYCSHVMEHVADPVAFAAELARVAPRGVVVVPHAFKDAIFNFEDATHRWWCFAPVAPGAPLRMMRVDPALVARLASRDLRMALCRLYRSEPQLSRDHAFLKQWVDIHEPDLDVIVPWDGALRVEVIG